MRTYQRFVFLVMSVGVLVATASCTRQQQAVTAASLAVAAAHIDAPLRKAETEAGLAELERVKAAGGSAEEGDKALASLEAKWNVAFTVLDLFLTAEDMWLDGKVDWSSLVAAACKVVVTAGALAPDAIGEFVVKTGGLCK